MKILILALCALFGATLAADTPAKKKAGIGAAAPARKPYIYKDSDGKPRQMEIYFPPNHDPANAKVPGMIL
jgi:hypothetical protein